MRHHRPQDFRLEKQIDETGAGDFSLGDIRRDRQRCDQRGSDLARVAFQRFC
jgi:hypothetical protein